MKLKRLACIGVAAVMGISMLAGCGSTEKTEQPAPVSQSQTEAAADNAAETKAPAPAETPAPSAAETPAPAQAEATADAQAPNEQPAGNGKYNVTWDDTEEINVMLMCPAAVPPGVKEVEDAINAITEEEIDVHVNYEMIEPGNYVQQVSLRMSAQEKVDLMLTFPAGPASFMGLVSNNQLMDITELMDKYAPRTKELVANQLAALTINGHVMAVPIVKGFGGGVYLAMRTDVLEDLGLVEKAENLKSYREFGEILEAVHNSEKWSYLAGMVGATAGSAVYYCTVNTPGLDDLNDPTIWDSLITDILVVDPTGEDPTVKFIAETDAFREIVELGEEWYNKGYIYKDANTSTDAGFTLIKGNKAFSTIQAGEMLGFNAYAEQSCGMPMTTVRLLTSVTTTAACNKFTWAVPISATAPEAAITFAEMMATDPRINNLMAWGIEGRDYVVTPEGLAQYPDGVSEPPYHGADFITGNIYLTIPWVGNDPDCREQSQALQSQVPVSYFLGFTFDTSEVETDIAAVNSVFAEYNSQIGAGINATAVLDEYIAKQKANGIDNVIAECQRQLDEWIANNK